MTDFFTVPQEKEPTEQQAREAASALWSKWMQNAPKSFQEKGRAEFIEAEWESSLHRLRAQVGEPLASVEYSRELDTFGDLMTVKEFRENVECGGFIDYDGFGIPVKDSKQADFEIYPSIQHLIPLDATHIQWFNG